MTVMTSTVREPGLPHIDHAKCTRCDLCKNICPCGIFRRDGNAAMQVDPAAGLGCVGCGHCEMICPADAVQVTGRNLRPDHLFPRPAPRATPAALEALMQSRRSIRNFRNEPVPRELLERIVTMATSAPMGLPPWDIGVAVLSIPERVKEVSSAVRTGYKIMPKIFNRVVLALLRPLLGKVKHDWFSGFLLPFANLIATSANKDRVMYDAPAALIFHGSPYADAADCTIACTYAMLAAESLGLGSCMLGSVSPILGRNRELMERVGIPAGHKPQLVLLVGYPKYEFRKSIRREFVSVKYV